MHEFIIPSFINAHLSLLYAENLTFIGSTANFDNLTVHLSHSSFSNRDNVTSTEIWVNKAIINLLDVNFTDNFHLRATDCPKVVIDNCVFSNSSSGAYATSFVTCGDISVKNSKFTLNSRTCVYASQTIPIYLENNEFAMNREQQIQGLSPVIINRCRFVNILEELYYQAIPKFIHL